jgi:hypothetical protein
VFLPSRATEDDRPLYPRETLTLPQVRDALAAWFRAWPLGPGARKRLLKREAWRISYTRHRNARAQASHRKLTLRRLRKRGIQVAKIRACIGSNFAL